MTRERFIVMRAIVVDGLGPLYWRGRRPGVPCSEPESGHASRAWRRPLSAAGRQHRMPSSSGVMRSDVTVAPNRLQPSRFAVGFFRTST